MRPSAETLLMLLIVALYLQDSLMFLRPDEAVLVRGIGKRWRVGFGTRSWRLSGREPYLCNPFTPHAPVFRLHWEPNGRRAPPKGAPSAPERLGADGAAVPLRLLSVLVWITWCELFVLVPLTLTGTEPAVSPLEVAGLLYVTIALSIVVLWIWRAPLGLSGKAFTQTALECVLCAPYAANLVRRIGFACRVDEDFLRAAERLASPGQIRIARQQCLFRINEQIEMEVGEASSADAGHATVSSTLEQLRMASARLTEEVADEFE